MSGFIKKLTESGMSRRDFIAASAAATASIGLFGLSGCQPNKPKENEVVEKPGIDRKPITGGNWVTFACNYDCGNRCLVKAYVIDGVAIRLKTDDTTDDTKYRLQARACVRGRSMLNFTYAPDKLKYPLKRKNWSPGNPNGHLRGIDEWERISWDEAVTTIVSELKKAQEKYGPKSILSPCGTGSHPIYSILNLSGGYIAGWYTSSYGSWLNCDVFGFSYSVGTNMNSRFDAVNTKTFMMFGNNPIWSSPGNPAYYYTQLMKDAGCKFFSIDPFYSDSAAQFDAEWIPVRYGTDAALYLAIAYTMITEDNPATNPLIDWDFLRKYTVGFDETMMPAGADPKHNFKAYVLGQLDGKPKTPEWAYEICGAEPDKIKKLARELGMKNAVTMVCGYASARQVETSSVPPLFVTLGCMGGHIGKSGHNCACSPHRSNINGGTVYRQGADGLSALPATTMTINVAEIWDAVLTGKTMMNTGRGTGPNVDAEVDIHVIACASGNSMETTPKSDRAVEAFRKVDFVFTVNQYASGNSKYSDIVLPETSKAEDLGEVNDKGVYCVHVFQRAIEPLYEAKSARDMARLFMKKMGVEESKLYPFSDKQAWFNQLVNTTVLDSDGKTMVKMCTITQQDIDEWKVEGKPQEGKIAMKEVIEVGKYQPDVSKFESLAFNTFIRDPVGRPLSTPSGKFEIYSEAYAKSVNQLRYTKIDPLPMYRTGPHRYEDSFIDWEKKIKGAYPYQMISIHYLGHAHTYFSSCEWVQEAFAAPLYMNAQDARDNGIEEGDTVLVEGKNGGRILRHAHVTECMMPGQMALPYGNWKDVDPATGIDIGAAASTCNNPPPTGFGVSAFNSMLVRVFKYSGPEMLPDYLKPRRVLYQD